MGQRKRSAPEQRPERVGRQAAALILGIPERTVTFLAQRGEVPGSAKIGRRWNFNEDRLRAWVLEKEHEAEARGAWVARGRTSTPRVRPQRSTSAGDIDRQYEKAMESLLHPPRPAP